ncbi:MAG: hypothetical protein AAF533_21405 [Acidobacteriota bacterium]
MKIELVIALLVAVLAVTSWDASRRTDDAELQRFRTTVQSGGCADSCHDCGESCGQCGTECGSCAKDCLDDITPTLKSCLSGCGAWFEGCAEGCGLTDGCGGEDGTD